MIISDYRICKSIVKIGVYVKEIYPNDRIDSNQMKISYLSVEK